MNSIAEKFQPIWDEADRNPPAANALIEKFVKGDIKILPLFECDKALFEEVSREAMNIVSNVTGQIVAGDHVTYKYVKAQDPSWEVKPGAVQQYSLYNSKDNLLYTDEDHHWQALPRRFATGLKAIPAFVKRYFGDSELQNFRLQTINTGGSLGQHREKIVGIPNREHHYKVRFHLPCVTNPSVRFLMDGQEFFMRAGTCYVFNQSCMHGVSNDNGALRAHLVWDCYLNEHILQNLIAPALAAAR